MSSWLVIGGGFQGIAAASLLRSRNCGVTVVERAPSLGGVLNSKPVAGLFLDYGCHLFTNSESDTTRLLFDLLGDEYHAVHVRYASVTEGRKEDGIAVPDFSHLHPEDKRAVLREMEEAVGRSSGAGDEGDFRALLEARYGAGISRRLEPAVEKWSLAKAGELDANTLFKSPVSRIRIFDDVASLSLKKNPGFDQILAVPSQDDPMRFYQKAMEASALRNFYPKEKGLRGFCESAEAYLAGHGVEILKGRAVSALQGGESGVTAQLDDGRILTADHVMWTMDPSLLSHHLWQDSSLGKLSVQVPVVLFYFLVPADLQVGYTYVHDFTPGNIIFRASSPGFYGHQVNEKGLSYLCAEIPAKVGSPIWENPDGFKDEVWREMRALGMVDLEQPVETYFIKTPVSYPLCRPGYRRKAEELQARCTAEFPRIHMSDPNAFQKSDIVAGLRERIEKVLGPAG